MISQTNKIGFTLLEVVIAIFILAFSMIPIANIMGYGFAGTLRDSRQIQAIQICQSRLNQALLIPYDQLVTSNTDIISGNQLLLPLGNIANTPYNVSLFVRELDVNFTCRGVDIRAPNHNRDDPSTWQVLPEENFTVQNKVKLVRITVSWQEKGTTQNVSFESYKVKLER